jgi:hypothetical protein
MPDTGDNAANTSILPENNSFHHYARPPEWKQIKSLADLNDKKPQIIIYVEINAVIQLWIINQVYCWQ